MVVAVVEAEGAAEEVVMAEETLGVKGEEVPQQAEQAVPEQAVPQQSATDLGVRTSHTLDTGPRGTLTCPQSRPVSGTGLMESLHTFVWSRGLVPGRTSGSRNLINEIQTASAKIFMITQNLFMT